MKRILNRVELPKIYLGPMSVQAIDAVCKDNSIKNFDLGFVVSRRQVDHCGGYVSSYTPDTLRSYIDSNHPSIIMERDHAGPMQGALEDDGVLSIVHDTKYFDIIHVDTWKVHKNIEDAALMTSKYIKECEKNGGSYYEVGTEESIRPYNHKELETFLEKLKKYLGVTFEKVLYAVIQAGTKIEGYKNTGIYDKNKLKEMIKVCKTFDLLSKEHNGDYQDENVLHEKYNYGLSAVNIAPEIGLMQSKIVLEILRGNKEKLSTFYDLCYNLAPWKKWLKNNFKQEDLILCCGHYVFSNPTYKSIISGYEEFISKSLSESILNRLKRILNVSM